MSSLDRASSLLYGGSERGCSTSSSVVQNRVFAILTAGGTSHCTLMGMRRAMFESSHGARPMFVLVCYLVA